MGTSGSSKGSPSGVPLTPPWVPPAPADGPPPAEGPAEGASEDGGDPALAAAVVPPAPVVIAPRGRFAAARTSLGDFARGGGAAAMRRGLGHYVKTGLQGSRNAAQRFGGTATSAGALYDALTGLASAQPAPNAALDRAILEGKSAQEVITAIIEAVRPVDGTQDGEAGRDAMQRALSATLEQFPDADLLDLGQDQRLFAIERFVAQDVFNRACLDLAKHVQDSAPSATAALARLTEIRDYIRQVVSSAFRRLKSTGESPNTRRVGAMARDALREALQVFASEAP